MDNLNLDLGLKSVKLHENGGVLSFNPTDPNIVYRYRELEKLITDLAPIYEEKISKADDDDDARFDSVRDIDLQIKDKLSYTFGSWNDFDAIFMGTHFMALSNDGNPVIYNFLDRIAPMVSDELKERSKKLDQAMKKAEAAKAKQAANRAQRRAMK